MVSCGKLTDIKVKKILTSQKFMKLRYLLWSTLLLKIEASNFNGVSLGLSAGFATIGNTIEAYGPTTSSELEKLSKINHHMSGFQGSVFLQYLGHVSPKNLAGVELRWGMGTADKSIKIGWRQVPNAYKITLNDKQQASAAIKFGRLYDQSLMFSFKIGAIYHNYEAKYSTSHVSVLDGISPRAIKSNVHASGILAGIGANYAVKNAWLLGLEYNYNHYIGVNRTLVEDRDRVALGFYRNYRVKPNLSHSIQFSISKRLF